MKQNYKINTLVKMKNAFHSDKNINLPEKRGISFCCPVCGESNVHFGEMKLIKLDGANEDEINISMWCEYGHTWKLKIESHKGLTYLNLI